MFRFFFTIGAAFKPLIGGIILKEQTSFYTYPGRYASEHGELEQYRASYRANISCKEVIEHSITAHYGNNRLDPACVKQVVEQFGHERVFYVLANTVRQKDFDGRISHDNKAWAKQFRCVRTRTASAVTEMFILLWTAPPYRTDRFISYPGAKGV